LRAGPKTEITVPPLSFTGWPAGRAARRLRFVADYVVTPRGHGAGDPLKLRRFQRDIVTGAFAPGVRTALISIPRANGKTCLAAALGLAELFVGPPSAEVLVVASDQRQADITLKLARRMVELNPALAERFHVFRDRLYLPENDATLLPLPAEPDALHGHDPSLLVVDELHVVTREVWEAATTAAGKRAESLTLAISTPSPSPDTVMHELVEHGRAGDDPAFYFREFSAAAGCAVDDRAAWKQANPALACRDPFLAADALAALARTTRESTFRLLRLGQWVADADSWLPYGAWAACADADRHVADGDRIVLGFDGSASGDSTALIGATLDGHLFVVDIWANPGDPRWRVPRAEVANAVDVCFDRWEVLELACDPWGWRSELEAWAARYGERRVIEWPTNVVKRMAPATDRMYQAVADRRLSHDGDSRLAAHVAHATAKTTPMGDLIVKDRRGSPRKIDAAVAAVVAYDRAAHHAKTKTSRKVHVF
jgi:phage terminase large subunit-like protein